jgi:hypothetical protein
MERPARIPSLLSRSLNYRLNEYTLVATAAGVGALALAQPAEAKVIYTPAHVVIGKKGERFTLDLNHDGIGDFALFYFHAHKGSDFHTSILVAGYPNGSSSNLVATTGKAANGDGVAAALRKGSKIPGKSNVFRAGVLAGKSSSDYVGNWFPNVKDRYLGLTFLVKGKKHYGWARLSVETHKHPFTIKAILTGYAYETVTNKPIVAGKTTGPNVVTVQPGSLGHLARGAAVIARRPD